MYRQPERNSVIVIFQENAHKKQFLTSLTLLLPYTTFVMAEHEHHDHDDNFEFTEHEAHEHGRAVAE